MDLIAHRGFAAIGPENALPTLSAAEAGADAVEFDIRLAEDDIPVVFHDERVDRLTGERGRVRDFSAADLRSMSIGDSEATIPLLAEVLAALSGPIVADLKVDRLTEDVLSLLRSYGSRTLVSSSNPSILEALPRDFATAVLVVPPSEASDAWPEGAPRSFSEGVDLARSVGAVALHVPTALVNASRVRRAQSVVFAVNAWTVRERETAAAMRAAGVDGLIADDPEVV
ncbi:MAG: glycerophosphodiester phosphodiesterase [Salinirussus sp.]